jgi:hypothetical protein
MKTQGVAQLKKVADKFWSKATRLRFADKVGDEWVAECVTCKVRKNIKQLQCGHFVSRRFNILRYSEMNTAPQCYGCNVMQQGEQFKFAKWIDEFYGEGTAEGLMSQRHTTHKLTIQELENIIEDSKAEIKFYEEKG